MSPMHNKLKKEKLDNIVKKKRIFLEGQFFFLWGHAPVCSWYLIDSPWGDKDYENIFKTHCLTHF